MINDVLVVECAADSDTIHAVRRILAAKMGRAWLEFFPDGPRLGIVDIKIAPSWGGN